MAGLVLQQRPSLKKRVAKTGLIAGAGAALGYKAAKSPAVQMAGHAIKSAAQHGYAQGGIGAVKKGKRLIKAAPTVGGAAEGGAKVVRGMLSGSGKTVQRAGGAAGSLAGAVGFAAKKARMSRAGRFIARGAKAALRLIGEVK